jgi:hypothetical protein
MNQKVHGKHSKKYDGDHLPKRTNGVYYTEVENPFKLKPFHDWAKKIKLDTLEILEPFAGENHIIEMLKEIKQCNSFKSYDINPASPNVKKRDVMKDFPEKFKVCITNPPWLMRYSASRHGVEFPDIKYDNIYKHCLELAMKNCDNVGFIIPGTYLRTGLFKDRLDTIIFINSKLFMGTENPVCLALFTKDKVKETKVYHNDEFLGTLEKLKSYLPPKINRKEGMKIIFNSDNGNLGLICIDNAREESTRFCKANEIKRKMKISDRLLTKIETDIKDTDEAITILNKELHRVREQTHDVFLAPFKGLRKDGEYRRRLDYEFVRNLINKHCKNI